MRHLDGTYDVVSLVAVEGETLTDVGAEVKSWEGETLVGLYAQWYVDAATCVVGGAY